MPLSTLGITVENLDIGKNPLVSKLMKGVYNKMHPASKYLSTWDPSIVLAHFHALSNAAKKLPILQLVRKTAKFMP